MAKRILLTLIKIYQLSIGTFYTSPCRFFPSCSNYSMEAIRLHGAIKGGFLSLKRILRCNPWGGRGYDPVPLKKPHGFSKK